MKIDPQHQINKGLGAIMPLLGCMTSQVRHHVSRICKASGYDLTPEESDMLMIIRHFNDLPQSQLANMLGKDKAAITRLMNTLVKSGLVGRVQDQQDRRIIRAQITEEGNQAFVRLWPELKKLSEQALKDVSDSEMDQLCKVLAKMNANLHVPRMP
ncbi:MAG: MarR family transcriptional regulator [Mariprofundaceae bacterium]